MIKKFLNLGMHPIANSFLKKDKKLNLKSEFFYNLSVGFNEKNYLVSLMKPVNPKRQYTETYAHRASESKTMREAFRSIAKKFQKKFKPNLSMEIGSNDGVFIRNFNKKDVIAVEPCKNLAQITKKKKFKTYPDFWNVKLSKKILKENGKVDLVFSANTISHIPNLKETFDAISIILSDHDPLLSLVTCMSAAFATGNAQILVPSQKTSLLATELYQVLDTSDVPGGYINILTAKDNELNSTLSKHENIDGIWYFGNNQSEKSIIIKNTTSNLKKYWIPEEKNIDWYSNNEEFLNEFLHQSTQIKNIWIPYGE